MSYVSIYQSLQQEGFRVKTSNGRYFVTKITQYARLCYFCSILLIPSMAIANLTGSLSVEAITERLQPVAKCYIEGVDTTAAPKSAGIVGVGGPKDIYESNCKMCHQNGLAGAPKLGNKGDWQPRIGQGLDALVKAAWNGIRAMPPKGNCLQCTEDDIKKTVQYMLDASK